VVSPFSLSQKKRTFYPSLAVDVDLITAFAHDHRCLGAVDARFTTVCGVEDYVRGDRREFVAIPIPVVPVDSEIGRNLFDMMGDGGQQVFRFQALCGLLVRVKV